MNGNVIEVFTGGLEHGWCPVAGDGGGGEDFEVAVDGAHHLGGFAHEGRPFIDGLRANLSAEVVFISDAPVADIVGFGDAVGLAHVGALRPLSVEIAVLDPVAHFLRRAGAGVGADVWFRADQMAPLHELVGAEGIGVLDAPCFVEAGLAIAADSIPPVVGRSETSARPSDNGDLEFAQSFNDVSAEPLLSERGEPGSKTPP